MTHAELAAAAKLLRELVLHTPEGRAAFAQLDTWAARDDEPPSFLAAKNIEPFISEELSSTTAFAQIAPKPHPNCTCVDPASRVCDWCAAHA